MSETYSCKPNISLEAMTKQLLYLFSFALIFVSFSSSGQEVTPLCAHDLVLQKWAEKHPNFQGACTDWHEHTIRGAKEKANARTNTVYEIQVVFHVVWNADSENLADEVIHDQMAILNQDYRRLNPDADQTREIFLPVAADPGIEFVLASVDPEGNPTDGINRVNTDRTSFEFDFFSQDITLDEVKSSATGGADPWDTERYLNIWVCNISSGFPGVQPFGFAYPPNGAPLFEGTFGFISDNVQGIVIHYTAIGSNNPAGMEDDFDGNEGGRTLTHEAGHFFGLRHTWGDAFFNGCTVDDGIEDTPNIASNNNFACNFNLNTCDDDGDDLPDMGENFMDYNRDDCVNVFTQQQVDAMRFALEELRPGLIEGQIEVGVAERKREKFEIFPNPANQNLTLNNRLGASIDLVDLSGRIVATWNKLGENARIDVSNLQRGVYILRDIRTGQTAKLILN